MELFNAEILLHGIIGGAGAAAGWFGSGWCRHLWHRLAITGGIVYIEAVVSVAVVG